MNSYQVGLFSEWLAKLYLRLHGFSVVKQRYVSGRHTNRAEIDLIAKRGNLIIFVEVKNRPTLKMAWDAITPKQISRLRLAANTYLINTKWMGNTRFDVIYVHKLHITWIRGAI